MMLAKALLGLVILVIVVFGAGLLFSVIGGLINPEQQAYEDGYTDAGKYICEALRKTPSGELPSASAIAIVQEKKESGAEGSRFPGHYYRGWEDGSDDFVDNHWTGPLKC